MVGFFKTMITKYKHYKYFNYIKLFFLTYWVAKITYRP